jgi:hypothetical protein
MGSLRMKKSILEGDDGEVGIATARQKTKHFSNILNGKPIRRVRPENKIYRIPGSCSILKNVGVPSQCPVAEEAKLTSKTLDSGNQNLIEPASWARIVVEWTTVSIADHSEKYIVFVCVATAPLRKARKRLVTGLYQGE